MCAIVANTEGVFGIFAFRSSLSDQELFSFTELTPYVYAYMNESRKGKTNIFFDTIMYDVRKDITHAHSRLCTQFSSFLVRREPIVSCRMGRLAESPWLGGRTGYYAKWAFCYMGLDSGAPEKPLEMIRYRVNETVTLRSTHQRL